MKEEQGYLQLAAELRPPLAPGRYTVTTGQNLEQPSISDFKAREKSLEVIIAAEQVAMDPGQVYSRFPPAEARGIYGDCLPHVILQRETLPWERALKNGRGEEIAPVWIALLVFTEDEGLATREMEYGQARQARPGLWNPRDGSHPGEVSEFEGLDKDACLVLDVPRPLLTAVLPALDELPLLAHVRRVSLERKVTDPSVRTPWFSCLVANRYPLAPAKGQDPIPHEVHLVALEGYGDYLAAPENHPLTKCDTCRFFSLANWKFHCDFEDFNFQSLAQSLSAGPLRAEVEVGQAELQRLINLGYVPLDHHFREGSRSVAWYRSPLLPQAPWGDRLAPTNLADQWAAFDPDQGLFDVSLSAAWQLGRLLGFQQKDFAERLLKWRLKHKGEAADEQNARALSRALGLNEPPAERGLSRNWRRGATDIFRSLAEDCGRADPSGLDDRGVPRFPAAARGLKSQGALSQRDLLSLYETES